MCVDHSSVTRKSRIAVFLVIFRSLRKPPKVPFALENKTFSAFSSKGPHALRIRRSTNRSLSQLLCSRSSSLFRPPRPHLMRRCHCKPPGSSWPANSMWITRRWLGDAAFEEAWRIRGHIVTAPPASVRQVGNKRGRSCVPLFRPLGSVRIAAFPLAFSPHTRDQFVTNPFGVLLVPWQFGLQGFVFPLRA